MDYKKDNQTSGIRQPEDRTQGQLMAPKSSVTVLKSINDFDGMNHEIAQAFLFKKAEKLATALYLVTSFLSDNEPLKRNIREAGINIISDITSFGNTTMSDTVSSVKKVMSDIEKVVALLEISATAGFMSEMNLTILREEYLSLVQALGSRKKEGESGFVFGREFFSTRETSTNSFGQEEKTGVLYKGHLKDTPPSSSRMRGSTSSFVGATLSDNLNNKSQNQFSEVGKNTRPQKNTEDKESRREMIISLIQEKGELSIKDITTHFSTCGEKTIQRELAALVATNVLKKTGDRRWSRYSLFVL
ncbi:MAG: hypothetical protein NT098_02745 [Candidatus Parcubacteria bacterium]|nr:hypothetical protein [Candidatus Parcubacteria bacterium]